MITETLRRMNAHRKLAGYECRTMAAVVWMNDGEPYPPHVMVCSGYGTAEHDESELPITFLFGRRLEVRAGLRRLPDLAPSEPPKP
jgi:hypothetical protein